jgi:hypothetical protein
MVFIARPLSTSEHLDSGVGLRHSKCSRRSPLCGEHAARRRDQQQRRHGA